MLQKKKTNKGIQLVNENLLESLHHSSTMNCNQLELDLSLTQRFPSEQGQYEDFKLVIL